MSLHPERAGKFMRGWWSESGTCYHRRSRHCHHCRLSSVHWRRNCFADRTTTHTSGNSSVDTSL